MSSDWPAGVKNKVACPPSTSTKNIRNVFAAPGADFVRAAENKVSARIEHRITVAVRIRRKNGVRGMFKTCYENSEHRDHLPLCASRQEKPS
jgi:hypothetical protein